MFRFPKAEGRTTLRLSNLPVDIGSLAVVDMLDSQGLHGLYDFVHVPVDMLTGDSKEYAIINMISDQVAELVAELLQSFNGWITRQQVKWHDDVQGLDALVEVYRNSSLMHPIVPERLKPAFFSAGCRAAFPKPTKVLTRPLLLPPDRRLEVTPTGACN